MKRTCGVKRSRLNTEKRGRESQSQPARQSITKLQSVFHEKVEVTKKVI